MSKAKRIGISSKMLTKNEFHKSKPPHQSQFTVFDHFILFNMK